MPIEIKTTTNDHHNGGLSKDPLLPFHCRFHGQQDGGRGFFQEIEIRRLDRSVVQ